MDRAALRILLVEDNPANADFLQETLDETNEFIWTITHVETLSAALEAIFQERFDIVLSDLSLPDAQGLDSVIEIHAAVPELPIVVLTGLSDEDIGLRAVRHGAQDYLVKGQIQPELLVRTIRYAIERSQTQQVMQQQAAAMAASMEGIAILNAKREHVYVNQAFVKLYGYEQSDELIGMTLERLYHDAEYEPLWQIIEPAIQQQGYWRGEVIARRRNQDRFDQELLITALKDGGFVCNIRDITDRKRAEAEVLQALEQEKELNELKSRFVAIVSHEFRTPLTTILSSVELLRKYSHQVSDEKNQARFDRIISGVHRMTQLLDDVLIFNKTEAGSLAFKPSWSNIVQLSRDVVEEMQLQVSGTHQIEFAYLGCDGSELESNYIYLLDEQLLRHVLTNLISNAVKYSPKEPHILVRLICEPTKITFYIRDRGIGIPTADLERLFNIFHRGSNVGNIPGTGLGLPIVKQCIDLHRGSISVISEVNHGTEFRVTIPTELAEPNFTHHQQPIHTI